MAQKLHCAESADCGHALLLMAEWYTINHFCRHSSVSWRNSVMVVTPVASEVLCHSACSSQRGCSRVQQFLPDMLGNTWQ